MHELGLTRNVVLIVAEGTVLAGAALEFVEADCDAFVIKEYEREEAA